VPLVTLVTPQRSESGCPCSLAAAAYFNKGGANVKS